MYICIYIIRLFICITFGMQREMSDSIRKLIDVVTLLDLELCAQMDYSISIISIYT